MHTPSGSDSCTHTPRMQWGKASRARRFVPRPLVMAPLDHGSAKKVSLSGAAEGDPTPTEAIRPPTPHYLRGCEYPESASTRARGLPAAPVAG